MWMDIPAEQFKTTEPRKLVQYMNTYIHKWKCKFDEVQKVIDALPESADQTVDIQADDKKSLTVSDNMSQLEEEKNDQKVPLTDQETKIFDDHAEIPNQKVAKVSKADAAKPNPEHEAMITPATES